VKYFPTYLRNDESITQYEIPYPFHDFNSNSVDIVSKRGIILNKIKEMFRNDTIIFRKNLVSNILTMNGSGIEEHWIGKFNYDNFKDSCREVHVFMVIYDTKIHCNKIILKDIRKKNKEKISKEDIFIDVLEDMINTLEDKN